MKSSRFIVVGAGAAGLMCARELAKAGKQVTILEARNRVGGRIQSLPKDEFGYPAEVGAEFVHGEARITRSLMKEAGLKYISQGGESWSTFDGELSLYKQPLTSEDETLLDEKLAKVTEDISIADFIEQNFVGETKQRLQKVIFNMVEGYDAADPNRISTLALKDEWLGNSGEWLQGRVEGGYKAILDFLQNDLEKLGVEILLNKEVVSISIEGGEVGIKCRDDSTYIAQKIIVTVPLPILSTISFAPSINEKIKAASKIGWAGALKLLLKFKEAWWLETTDKDLSKMTFLFTDEEIPTWWTQYPDTNPTLTGWIGGPKVNRFASFDSVVIKEAGIKSLSNIFKVDKQYIEDQLETYVVANWPVDKYSLCAYSYHAFDTGNAYSTLLQPAEDKIFFAGEALGIEATATVEGAFASGLETVRKIVGDN